jgi:hypothetical protein
MQSESSLAIGSLLERLQAESVNQGGLFQWLEVANPTRMAAYDCLYDYLEAYERGRFIAADTRNHRHLFIPNILYQALKINPWFGGWDAVWERGLFWCRFASVFHTHPDITEAFWPLWNEFQALVTHTVEQSGLRAIHSVADNRALYALCDDHVSEEILFETDQKLYILHFGMSS